MGERQVRQTPYPSLRPPSSRFTSVLIHQHLGSSALCHKRPPLLKSLLFQVASINAMCYTITEGVRFGCGHYTPLRILGLSERCMDERCMTSETHPKDCQQCPGSCRLVRTTGEERVRFRMNGWCSSCRYMLQRHTSAPPDSSPDNPTTPSQPQPSL